MITLLIRRVGQTEAKEGGKKVYHDEPQRKPGHQSSSQSSSNRDTNGSSGGSKERVNKNLLMKMISSSAPYYCLI